MVECNFVSVLFITFMFQYSYLASKRKNNYLLDHCSFDIAYLYFGRILMHPISKLSIIWRRQLTRYFLPKKKKKAKKKHKTVAILCSYGVCNLIKICDVLVASRCSLSPRSCILDWGLCETGCFLCHMVFP